MSRYRRATATGSSYFFTVVAYRRQPILCDEAIRRMVLCLSSFVPSPACGGGLGWGRCAASYALRAAIETVRVARPFVIDAWVLLPDHLHCVWTLPDGDADFSTRWMKIKRAVSLACGENYRRADWITASKLKYRESTIWQRRFWEHQTCPEHSRRVRDENDFAHHVDYIHSGARTKVFRLNPFKHGHVQQAKDWPHSTFTAMYAMGYMRMTGLVRWIVRCWGMLDADSSESQALPTFFIDISHNGKYYFVSTMGITPR